MRTVSAFIAGALSGWSIRRKLIGIILLLTLFGLSVVFVGMTINTRLQFERSLDRDMTVLADIIGNNSRAALLFNDPVAATEILGALSAKPRILRAILYDGHDRQFAEYRRERAVNPPALPAVPGEMSEFRDGYFALVHDIRMNGRLVGRLYLASDLEAWGESLRNYIVVFVLLATLTVALTLALALFLQRVITAPIGHLVETAGEVSRRKDYGLRAGKTTDDELGMLVDGFNAMLDEIQQRDAELVASHALLEHRVRERTAELAQVNDALRKSEASYRAITDTASDAVITADQRGNITYFNKAAERIFGYSAAQVLNESLTVLMPERHRAAHAAGLRRFVETGEARVLGKPMQLAGRRKDGEEFPVELSLATWKVEGAVFFTGILRDITAAKQAEDALRKSEERLRLIVDGVKDYAIYMLDPQGYVASWNAGAERIKGYPADEIIGRHFSIFYPDEDRKQGKPERELEAARRTGTYEEEGWRVRRDDTRFWADVVVTAVRDAKGGLLGFAKITRDISERRQAEEKIMTLNRMLETRNTALESLNRELEAFSYSVSHDLRAPLRAMDGFSRAVLEDYAGFLDAQGKDYLQRVRAASQRMGQLIDDLLRLARISRGELRRGDIDLSALALELVSEFRRREPGRDVEVSIEPDARAWADPDLMRVMLDNLLGNAWKFTGRRDRARIEFGRTDRDGATVFFVRDNGAGFDMSYAGKLFGAFQRLHGREEFEGTGIGLATVQRIVHRHGGRVWAEAEAGRGATFYFTLPSISETT